MSDEELIQKRLMHRERSGVRTVALNVIELLQGRATVEGLLQELETVELHTKRQRHCVEGARLDREYFAAATQRCAEEKAQLLLNIETCKGDLEHEEDKRRNLVDYEKLARTINKLPSALSLNAQLSATQSEQDLAATKAATAASFLNEVKKHSKLLVHSLQQLLALSSK